MPAPLLLPSDASRMLPPPGPLAPNPQTDGPSPGSPQAMLMAGHPAGMGGAPLSLGMAGGLPAGAGGVHPLDQGLPLAGGAGGAGGPLGVSLGGSGVLPPNASSSSSSSTYNYGPYGPAGLFSGTAPTPTPYGSFTGPDPSAVASDPYYQFRAKEGEKAIQRSAASHGTLLNGGTLKALEGYRQGLASEEAGKAFDRALSTYDTNRSTNAQNFGEAHTSFGDSLAGFNANSGNALEWAKFNQAKDEYANAQNGSALDWAKFYQDKDRYNNAHAASAGNPWGLGSYSSGASSAPMYGGSASMMPVYGSTGTVMGQSASTNAKWKPSLFGR